jgi:hypothetical protein
MSRKAAFLTVPDGVKLPKGYNPTVNRGAPFCQFEQPIERAFKPNHKNLLITVATGKSAAVLRVTRPNMEEYARFIGADFIALDNRTQTWPLAEKFRLGWYAQRYERVLYVDADVFIRGCAPDIFETVPVGAIAMHNDFQEDGPIPAWLKAENESLSKSQGVEIPPGCWNSGVVVFDGVDSDIWQAPPKPFAVSHCMEQNWVQRNAFAKGRVMSLSPVWNWQFWIHPTFENIDEAFFVHVSGMHGRSEMLLPLLRALALR